MPSVEDVIWVVEDKEALNHSPAKEGDAGNVCLVTNHCQPAGQVAEEFRARWRGEDCDP